MKKKLLTFGLVTVLAISTSVMAFASTNNKVKEIEAEDNLTNILVKVTEQEAIQIASQSVDPSAVFVKSELEDENGVIVYGVEFTLQNQELDVKVDANTGEILATDQDSEEADNEADTEKDNEDQDNDQVEHENDGDEEGHED